mgnify:CR=1 FL=1
MIRLITLLFGFLVMLAIPTIGYSEAGIEKKEIKVAIDQIDLVNTIQSDSEALLLRVPVEGTEILVIKISPTSVTIVIEPFVLRDESQKVEDHIRPPPAGPL